MKVTVLLFGPYADAVGAGRVDVGLDRPGPPTVDDVRNALAEEAPEIRAMLPGARLAVNRQLTAGDHVVMEADEVALIGMVGGG